MESFLNNCIANGSFTNQNREGKSIERTISDSDLTSVSEEETYELPNVEVVANEQQNQNEPNKASCSVSFINNPTINTASLPDEASTCTKGK